MFEVLEQHDLWSEAAAMIGRYEGWTQSAVAQERRLRQVLNHPEERHFDVQWAVILVRLAEYRGGRGAADAIMGAFMDAAYEGRKAREAMSPLERDGPLKVGPRRSERRAG